MNYFNILKSSSTLVLALALATRTPSSADENVPSGKFAGVPRDIDYIKNLAWVQVIVQRQGAGPGPIDLVYYTKNEAIERILLMALSKNKLVNVDYIDANDNPKRIAAVSLSVDAKEEQGQVFSLFCSDKESKYQATVYDRKKRSLYGRAAHRCKVFWKPPCEIRFQFWKYRSIQILKRSRAEN